MRVPVSVVIPAYNEGPRIGTVVDAALRAELPSQVLVVSDGSTDDTVQQARRAGAEVFEQWPNAGKAAAMSIGVEAARYEGICFLDADLLGLQPHHVDDLVRPWIEGRAKMVIGAVTPGQRIVSVLAGPRMLSRTAWRFAVAVEPEMVRSGYGIEVGLTVVANRYGWSVVVVPWDGVGNVFKGAKWGNGMGHSLRMWGRVLRTAGRTAGKRIGSDLFDHLFSGGGYAVRHDR